MITYEQDPDFVRWGLQFFDDPYYASYYGETNYNDTECSTNVENDEIIAHALQEELSQLAVTEEDPGSPHQGLEHLQVSVFSQDWLDQSVGNCDTGQEFGQEEGDDIGPSTSCSSPDENTYCGDDWSYSLELRDEYALDGEVGKRLNLMVPVPHVPRINGEIPSVDEATLDHQRLLDRLQLYQLVEQKVQGDGNCQFRALSDQFYRSPEHHNFVREQIINQLKSCPEIYESYVPMAYGDYLEKMSKSGEWGDHVTLQAAADSYGVKIFVITSFKDTCYIEILPNLERSKRVICLSFWAEVHYNSIYPEGDYNSIYPEGDYNSIYPEGDVPASVIKRKKRRWMLRNKHLESPDEYADRMSGF